LNESSELAPQRQQREHHRQTAEGDPHEELPDAGGVAGRAGTLRLFLEAVVNATMRDPRQVEYEDQSTWLVGLLQHPRLGGQKTNQLLVHHTDLCA